MVKFIIITKKNLLKFFLVILILILISIFINSYFKKENFFSTFLPSAIYSELKKDFNGDGIEDFLVIDESNSHYIIKVKTSKTEYTLKNKTFGEALIDIYDSFNIQVDSLDLSRDGLPEIIICGYKNNSPITYIFKWNGVEFIESFSTSNNIFGILDSNNSRTPKILYTLSDKGDKATNAFIFNGTDIKDLTFSMPQIPSLGVIQKFIDLVQLEYEIYETPDLFSPYIDSNQLSILWSLSKDTFRYAFQTGYFNDITWDSNGIPTSVVWILSFEKVNSQDSSVPTEEMILSIKTDIDQFGGYKVSRIKKL